MFDAKNIELEKYQHKNGLFPAAVGPDAHPMMKNFWIRDNYYIYLAVNEKSKNRMTHAFQNIVDYLEHLGKFDYRPTEDYMYIHPRYNENLKEISGEWAWVQNDSVGNLLEILADVGDRKRTKLIVDYLETIAYWKCPDSGFWEEKKEIRSSSLAACIRGLENYHKKIQNQEIRRISGPENSKRIFKETKEPNKCLKEMIEKGYKSLESLLPNETETRAFDLALLSTIYPKQVVSNDIKEKITVNLYNHLYSEKYSWGVKRYIGDTWNGKDNNLGKGKEMQWTIGLPWLYLTSKKIFPLQKATIIKQKYGTMPEGIIEGKPNCTKHLLWAEAMYKLAIDEFTKENKK